MTTTDPAPAVPADEPASPAAKGLEHREVVIILLGLLTGMVLAALDGTIVATALPTITADLGGVDSISWVVTAYMLATTVSTPLHGKLGDLYGRKRLFQASIVIFLAGSVLCGIAGSIGQLIVFRAIQGVGGGGLMVLGQAIIADIVSPRERGRYQGIFGAVFGGASVAGPLLGGFVTDHLSWHWVFLINLPVGIVALVATALVLPPSVRRASVRIDWSGAALLSAIATLVVLITTWGGGEYAWGDPLILGMIAAAVVLTGLFVLVERGAAEPMLPLHLFRYRTFTLACSISVIVGAAMYSSINYLPVFLQTVTGSSATDSGFLITPQMLGMIAASYVTGTLISRTGRYRRFPIIGMGVLTGASLLLTTLQGSSGPLVVGAMMVVFGVGLGLTMQVMVLATQNEVPAAHLGTATSSVNFFRTIGGSIGVSLIGSMFASRLASGIVGIPGVDGTLDPAEVQDLPEASRVAYVDAFADALSGAYWYLVPAALLALGLALLLREQQLRTTTHHAAALD